MVHGGKKETIKNYKKKHSLNLTMLLKTFWDDFLSKVKVPQGDTPRPGNDFSKAMPLTISKHQVVFQMKRDKGRITKNMPPRNLVFNSVRISLTSGFHRLGC